MMDRERTAGAGELRDELALERTRLANERTLLSYFRTAIALWAGTAALIHLFPDRAWSFPLAGLLFLAGALLLGVGTARFLGISKRLRAMGPATSAGEDGRKTAD